MEPRVSLITLGVSDLERALGFYRGLGWAVAFQNDTTAFIDLSGVVLALFDRGALAEDMKRPCEGTGAVALAHNLGSEAEVDALFARALAAGAQPLKAPCRAEWGGYSGYFADPDGHAWEVAHNPYWTILADGRIRMSA